MRKSKIEIGQKWENWFIQSLPLKLPNKTYRSVLVRCKCGSEKYISLSSLYQKSSTKCLSCSKNEKKEKRHLPLGTKHGSWKVIGKSILDKRNNTLIPVECKCGFKTKINKYDLLQTHSHNSCKSCSSFKGIGDLTGAYITGIKKGAEKRGLEFNLTTQQLWDLINQQGFKCALTGESITVNKNWRKYDFTASLDRINSTKGYTLDNIQWVHKRINKLKSNFTEDELKFWVEKLYNYQK